MDVHSPFPHARFPPVQPNGSDAYRYRPVQKPLQQHPQIATVTEGSIGGLAYFITNGTPYKSALIETQITKTMLPIQIIVGGETISPGNIVMVQSLRIGVNNSVVTKIAALSFSKTAQCANFFITKFLTFTAISMRTPFTTNQYRSRQKNHRLGMCQMALPE